MTKITDVDPKKMRRDVPVIPPNKVVDLLVGEHLMDCMISCVKATTIKGTKVSRLCQGKRCDFISIPIKVSTRKPR